MVWDQKDGPVHIQVFVGQIEFAAQPGMDDGIEQMPDFLVAFMGIQLSAPPLPAARSGGCFLQLYQNPPQMQEAKRSSHKDFVNGEMQKQLPGRGIMFL